MSDLMRFACDPHLDAMTRTWVFDALRDLTGQPFGDDPAAWRAWYSSVSGRALQPSRAHRHDLASAVLLQP